jgi:hypothetical protein
MIWSVGSDVAAIHLHAHEFEAERFRLGFDELRQKGDVRHESSRCAGALPRNPSRSLFHPTM